MELTKTDKDVIARLPDGWFIPSDLYVFIQRKQYRCERLEKLGVLESRIKLGEPLTAWWLPLQYRKVQSK